MVSLKINCAGPFKASGRVNEGKRASKGAISYGIGVGFSTYVVTSSTTDCFCGSVRLSCSSHFL